MNGVEVTEPQSWDGILALHPADDEITTGGPEVSSTHWQARAAAEAPPLLPNSERSQQQPEQSMIYTLESTWGDSDMAAVGRKPSQ